MAPTFLRRGEQDMISLSFCRATQISRVWRDAERRLLFRGWNRIRLYAATRSAADGAAAPANAAAAARAPRATAIKEEEMADAEDDFKAWKTGTKAGAEATGTTEIRKRSSGETAAAFGAELMRVEDADEIARTYRQRLLRILVRASDCNTNVDTYAVREPGVPGGPR